jgi:F420-non-reducing hydrogenase iron-sulfur subunit
MADFEPKILGFLCNWCCYAGADLAGTSRMQYPPTIRIIRIMCTARMDPAYILKAFAEGADAVFIGGCHFGDCHYVSGNYKADKRIKFVKDILEDLGIEKDRLMLRWISASEGEIFQKTMEDFTSRVKKLGPSPLRVD